MKTISEHIANRLAALNASHPGIAVRSPASLGNTIDRINRKISVVEMEVDGADFDQTKVPPLANPFKKAPMTWTCLGSDISLTVEF